jgi:hypothetical protein
VVLTPMLCLAVGKLSYSKVLLIMIKVRWC